VSNEAFALAENVFTLKTLARTIRNLAENMLNVGTLDCRGFGGNAGERGGTTATLKDIFNVYMLTPTGTIKHNIAQGPRNGARK